jgi:hypothetical protein
MTHGNTPMCGSLIYACEVQRFLVAALYLLRTIRTRLFEPTRPGAPLPIFVPARCSEPRRVGVGEAGLSACGPDIMWCCGPADGTDDISPAPHDAPLHRRRSSWRPCLIP